MALEPGRATDVAPPSDGRAASNTGIVTLQRAPAALTGPHSTGGAASPSGSPSPCTPGTSPAGGVLSLDTFFVLSGFLITGLLLREWQRRDEHIDLLAFWARRARRLLPALFVVLAAVVVYAAFVASPLGLDTLRGDVLATLGYIANWRFVLSRPVVLLLVHARRRPCCTCGRWRSRSSSTWCGRSSCSACSGSRAGASRPPARSWPSASSPVSARSRRRSRWCCCTYPGGDCHACTTAPTPARRRCSSARCSRSWCSLHGPVRIARRTRGRCRSPRRCRLVFVVAPWFAGERTRGPRLLLRAASGCSRTRSRPTIVLWRLTQPSVGVLRPRPRDDAVALGRRHLVRDVPLALADVPLPHRSSARRLDGGCAARGAARGRGRAVVGDARARRRDRSGAACGCVRRAWRARRSSCSWSR